MRTRSNKSYDITETKKRSTKSTSQHQRRTVKNLGDRQLRSAKSRAKYTSSSTTFKPTIIKVKKDFKKPTMQYDMDKFLRCKTIKFKRSASRTRWNYGKLFAAQAEAHRAAFQEAGVTQAPPPTWSYVRALAEKAAIRAVHRTAFQEAGVDRAPPPTWSYRKDAATKKATRTAHRAVFEDYGIDRTPSPTWSYRKSCRKNSQKVNSSSRDPESPCFTMDYERDESLRETRKSSTDISESSGFVSWSGVYNPSEFYGEIFEDS